MEGLLMQASVFVTSWNMKISLPGFGRLRQKIAVKGVPHVQRDIFLIQPIVKLLIFDVVDAVAVVIS